jgi:hypothetical protein
MGTADSNSAIHEPSADLDVDATETNLPAA